MPTKNITASEAFNKLIQDVISKKVAPCQPVYALVIEGKKYTISWYALSRSEQFLNAHK